MGIEGLANGFAKGIGFATDKIIFWKDWDQFSQLFLFGIIAFAFITFVWIKSKVMSQPNNKFRSRKLKSRRSFH